MQTVSHISKSAIQKIDKLYQISHIAQVCAISERVAEPAEYVQDTARKRLYLYRTDLLNRSEVLDKVLESNLISHAGQYCT